MEATKKCSNCGKIQGGDKIKCSCGYNFTTGTVENEEESQELTKEKMIEKEIRKDCKGTRNTYMPMSKKVKSILKLKPFLIASLVFFFCCFIPKETGYAIWGLLSWVVCIILISFAYRRGWKGWAVLPYPGSFVMVLLVNYFMGDVTPIWLQTVWVILFPCAATAILFAMLLYPRGSEARKPLSTFSITCMMLICISVFYSPYSFLTRHYGKLQIKTEATQTVAAKTTVAKQPIITGFRGLDFGHSKSFYQKQGAKLEETDTGLSTRLLDKVFIKEDRARQLYKYDYKFNSMVHAKIQAMEIKGSTSKIGDVTLSNPPKLIFYEDKFVCVFMSCSNDSLNRNFEKLKDSLVLKYGSPEACNGWRCTWNLSGGRILLSDTNLFSYSLFIVSNHLINLVQSDVKAFENLDRKVAEKAAKEDF